MLAWLKVGTSTSSKLSKAFSGHFSKSKAFLTHRDMRHWLPIQRDENLQVFKKSIFPVQCCIVTDFHEEEDPALFLVFPSSIFQNEYGRNREILEIPTRKNDIKF